MKLSLNAGRSARQWGRSIAWEISPVRRYGRHYLGVGIPLIVAGLFGTNLGILFVIGLAFFLVSSIMVSSNLKGEEVTEKRRQAKDAVTGGWAEFRFYFRLIAGLFFGVLTGSVFVLADRKIPVRKSSNGKVIATEANTDFVVVTRWGVFNCDLKFWRSKFEMIHGVLYYGRNDRKGKFGQRVSVQSTLFETEELAAWLTRKFQKGTIPTQSMWAVKTNSRLAIFTQKYTDDHKGGVRLAMDSTTVDGVSIMDHKKAAQFIRRHPKILSKAKTKEVAQYLNVTFPPMGPAKKKKQTKDVEPEVAQQPVLSAS